MARTRDFLDEWADWYSLPESSARAELRAPALPASFAPGLGFESPGSTAKRGLTSVLEGLLAWRGRARQRRALLQLGDHMLRDIGISRAEAVDEAAKPFWRG